MNLAEVIRTVKDEEQVLQEPVFNTGKKNELLFFYKPECFIDKSVEDFIKIDNMVKQKFQQTGTEISGVMIFPGSALDKYQIMNRHYGYIDQLSHEASSILEDDDLQEMKRKLELAPDSKIPALGGHELLAKFPELTADTLNTLWLRKKSIRLRSGFYYNLHEYKGEEFIFVNAFQPSQLNHFTSPDHMIFVYLLQSDMSWEDLKFKLAGDTYPEKAVPESIRGELYANKDAYHIKEIAISNNHVHLSAGPFEAMYEIWNFLHNVQSVSFDLAATRLGSLLKEKGIGKEKLESILNNPELVLNGEETDLFSETEIMDTEPAVDFYLEHFK